MKNAKAGKRVLFRRRRLSLQYVVTRTHLHKAINVFMKSNPPTLLSLISFHKHSGMFRYLVALLLASVAFGACPNQCSGHGECKNNDICTCYQNWQGPDCSLRTCAYGNSWALDAENPHSYEECSGAGLCDRTSGECQCFTGFSGYACQRRKLIVFTHLYHLTCRSNRSLPYSTCF